MYTYFYFYIILLKIYHAEWMKKTHLSKFGAIRWKSPLSSMQIYHLRNVKILKIFAKGKMGQKTPTFRNTPISTINCALTQILLSNNNWSIYVKSNKWASTFNFFFFFFFWVTDFRNWYYRFYKLQKAKAETGVT